MLTNEPIEFRWQSIDDSTLSGFDVLGSGNLGDLCRSSFVTLIYLCKNFDDYDSLAHELELHTLRETHKTHPCTIHGTDTAEIFSQGLHFTTGTNASHKTQPLLNASHTTQPLLNASHKTQVLRNAPHKTQPLRNASHKTQPLRNASHNVTATDPSQLFHITIDTFSYHYGHQQPLPVLCWGGQHCGNFSSNMASLHKI